MVGEIIDLARTNLFRSTCLCVNRLGVLVHLIEETSQKERIWTVASTTGGLAACQTGDHTTDGARATPRRDGRLSWQIQWVVMDAGVDTATDAGITDAGPAPRRRLVAAVRSAGRWPSK
jgi:hypothetical protein